MYIGSERPGFGDISTAYTKKDFRKEFKD